MLQTKQFQSTLPCVGRPYCIVVFSITGMEERFNKEDFSKSQHPQQESNILCGSTHSAFSNPYTNGISGCMYSSIVPQLPCPVFTQSNVLLFLLWVVLGNFQWSLTCYRQVLLLNNTHSPRYFKLPKTVHKSFTKHYVCNMYTWCQDLSQFINYFSLFWYYSKISDKHCSRKEKFVFVHI